MEQAGQGAQPTKKPAAEVTLRLFGLADVDAMMAWASDPQGAAPCRWEPYEATEPLLAFVPHALPPRPSVRPTLRAPAPLVPRHLPRRRRRPPRRRDLRVADGRRVPRGARGVATAAVRRAVAAVFGEVEGLQRVEALVDVANVASQRVLEKAGFRREAVLRRYCVLKGAVKDMVIFSFISTDTVLVD
uniref:Uncharacterized protein n=1 Tax=Aegilops tauschii TaxID=37682 RepID=R7W1T6_AEGTA